MSIYIKVLHRAWHIVGVHKWEFPNCAPGTPGHPSELAHRGVCRKSLDFQFLRETQRHLSDTVQTATIKLWERIYLIHRTDRDFFWPKGLSRKTPQNEKSLAVSPGCHVLCWLLGYSGPKREREGRKGMPGRGHSTGKGPEVRGDLSVVGEMQDAEDERRGEDHQDVMEKAGGTADPAEACNLHGVDWAMAADGRTGLQMALSLYPRQRACHPGRRKEPQGRADILKLWICP